MQHFINEAEFEALQPQLKAGTARISVPRAVARDFYLRVPNHSIRATAGQSELGTKFLVWVGIISAILLMLLCAAVIIWHFGWTAAFIVPLTGIFWTIVAGLTGDKGSFIRGTLALIPAGLLASLLPLNFAEPLVLLSCSLWIHRAVYLFAEWRLLKLVSSSFAAFDMLIEHLEITLSNKEQSTKEQSTKEKPSNKESDNQPS
jgi:hypothetical protein